MKHKNPRQPKPKFNPLVNDQFLKDWWKIQISNAKTVKTK